MKADNNENQDSRNEWRNHIIWQSIFMVSPQIPSLPRPWAIVFDEHATPEYRIEGASCYEGSMLLVSLEGEGFATIDGTYAALTPGTALLINRADPRIIYGCLKNRVEPWRFCFFYLRSGAEAIVDGITAQYGHLYDIGCDNGIVPLLRFYRGRGRNDLRLISPVAGAELCFRLFSLLVEYREKAAFRTQSQRVTAQIKGSINRNLHEPYNLNALASMCHFSGVHLMRMFKHETGMTIRQYLMAQKIRAARQMLENTTVSCKEVAELFGIEPGATFYRLFRKHTGETPRRRR